MSDDISLYDLLNVSIGTPQVGAVNFSALHALLHAVLEQLDIQQIKIRWRSPAPGDGQPGAPVEVTGRQAGPGRCNDEVQPGTEQQEGAEVSPSSGRAEDLQLSLLPRVQSCEEDVSKVRGDIRPFNSPSMIPSSLQTNIMDTEPCSVFLIPLF